MSTPRRNRPTSAARPAVYLRVSSEEQARSGLGIEAQRTACAAELERRGLAGAVEYKDDGISGTTPIAKRDGLRRLLADVEAGAVSIVVTLDTSRIARGVSLIKAVADVLTAHAVVFVSIKESYIDTSTAVGAMLFHNKIAIDQFESDITSERTRAALAERRRKHGYAAGPMPMGYQRQPGQECISIDDQAAGVVRAIFHERAHGASLAAIAALMNEQHPRPAGARWHPSTVKIILDNEPRYRGQLSHWPAVLNEGGA